MKGKETWIQANAARHQSRYKKTNELLSFVKDVEMFPCSHVSFPFIKIPSHTFVNVHSLPDQEKFSDGLRQ